jgi:hypothetical protein
MSEKVRILSFYENWVDIMEMCNPEEWYELTTIITNLRFKNIDTDPKTLTNIKVKMAWTAIRPSILKSNRNSRYQDKKSNTELQPNTDFEKEAEISPNKPDFYTDDTEVPQEVERASEGSIQGEFDNIEDEVYNEELNDDMGKFIGYVAGFEPAVETRGAAPQISMEELQKQTIEREKRREEYANNWKAHNVQIVETEPEERELTFEMIDRCVDRFDKDIALKQVKPYLSTEENIKRLRGRLNSVLQGFSQDERDWYYGLLIESKNQ